MTPMTINFRKNKMFCDSRFHKKTLSFNIMVTAVADFFEKILLLIIIFIIILNYFLLCRKNYSFNKGKLSLVASCMLEQKQFGVV
jgi:hypothetical protein